MRYDLIRITKNQYENMIEENVILCETRKNKIKSH